jgi:ribonucleoside-diphosphate reductase beta chain
MSIFDSRENIKPYAYPQLLEFVNAIDDSFWTVRKFGFERDVMDFKFDLSDVEKSFAKRGMLAISQIENTVKSFFGKLDQRMPIPEVSFVGSKMSANETTHSLAYSQCLEELGFNDDFKDLLEVPAIKDRITYLKKYLDGLNSRSNKEFTKSLILFTLLIENISLYAPFYCMTAIKKHTNKLKTVGKIVQATIREERIHSLFGATLIKIIKSEFPEWFDVEMEAKIRRNIRKAVEAEGKVVDWIFENGEPDYIKKEYVIEYLKFRANDSLSLIGYEPEYVLNSELLKHSKYLEVMSKSQVELDFFDDRATDYNKNINFEDESLFDGLE